MHAGDLVRPRTYLRSCEQLSFGNGVATKISLFFQWTQYSIEAPWSQSAMSFGALWIHNLESGDLVFSEFRTAVPIPRLEAYWEPVFIRRAAKTSQQVGVNWNEPIKIGNFPPGVAPSAAQWPSSWCLFSNDWFEDKLVFKERNRDHTPPFYIPDYSGFVPVRW